MNSQGPSAGAGRKELQGPRPSPLKIRRESHKIRKTAPAIPAAAPPTIPIMNRSQPMVIYMQSPKIIHAEVQDFMTLVQRLTGSSSMDSENLTADHHDSSTIQKASATTTSYQPAVALEKMSMPSTDTRSPDFVNPSSQWTTKIDSNQKIGSAGASEPTEDGPSAVTSASTVATATSALSPFSPNFLLPSPCFNFSPSIFQDLPLMTPNSDNLFYSPRDFCRISEPLFSPPPRSPLNSLTMLLQSPSTTTVDFSNTNSEH